MKNLVHWLKKFQLNWEGYLSKYLFKVDSKDTRHKIIVPQHYVTVFIANFVNWLSWSYLSLFLNITAFSKMENFTKATMIETIFLTNWQALKFNENLCCVK